MSRQFFTFNVYDLTATITKQNSIFFKPCLTEINLMSQSDTSVTQDLSQTASLFASLFRLRSKAYEIKHLDDK